MDATAPMSRDLEAMLVAKGVTIIETTQTRGGATVVQKRASLAEDVSNIWGVDLPRGTRVTMSRKGITIRVPGVDRPIRSKAALVAAMTRDPPPAERPVTRAETVNRAVTAAHAAQADAAHARQQRDTVQRAIADIFSIAAPFAAPTVVPPDRDATCKICMERVVDRFVKCGHVACGACLQTMIAQRPGDERVPCAFCMVPFGPEDVHPLFIA